MKKIIERNVALILTVSVFLIMFMSSCGSTKEMKQKVNYSDYINVNLVNSVDCNNCDEID